MTKRRLCIICNKREKHNARTFPLREEAEDEEDEEEDAHEEYADEEENEEDSDEEDSDGEDNVVNLKRKMTRQKKMMKTAKKEHQHQMGEACGKKHIGKRLRHIAALRGIAHTTTRRQTQQQPW